MMDFYRSHDSGTGDSIPRVVNEEPIDITWMLVNQLKNISSDIAQVKESLHASEDMYHQIQALTDTMGHLVRQNNALQESTKKMQDSLKLMTREMRLLRDGQNQNGSGKDSGADSMRQGRSKQGQRSHSKQQWCHIVHLEEALQENVKRFVDHMAFCSTVLPDKLIESDCLSDDECSRICSMQEKDQIRHLLLKLMGRGPDKIIKFLDIIKSHNYDYLTKDVYKSLERITSEQTQSQISCLVCYIKKNVDLRDIADYLFQVKMINREIYGSIIDPRYLYENREYIWASIINAVNASDNFDDSMKHLIDAIKGKYDYLTTFFQEPQFKVLQCSCGVRRRRLRKHVISDAGSQTDLSTTSEVPVPKFAKLASNDSYSETDSTSVLSSMDLRANFANLESYKTIASEPCDSTTPDISVPDSTTNERSRHNSGRFPVQDSQIDSTTEYTRQTSLPYVRTESTNGSSRPHFYHSSSQVSTTTVRPANSTGSSDNPWLTDSGESKQFSVSQSQTTGSPIDDKTIGIDITDTRGQSGATVGYHTGTENKQSSTDRETIHKVRRLRTTSEKTQEEAESSFADVEEDEVLPRTKLRSKTGKHGPKGHATVLLTKSRTFKELERKSYMKKKSKQRKERRERKLERDGTEDFFHQNQRKISHNPRQKKVPYNPTWSTHAQKPGTSSWDYNQARRHWMMSHQMARVNRNNDLESDQYGTEGSESLGLTE